MNIIFNGYGNEIKGDYVQNEKNVNLIELLEIEFVFRIKVEFISSSIGNLELELNIYSLKVFKKNRLRRKFCIKQIYVFELVVSKNLSLFNYIEL